MKELADLVRQVVQTFPKDPSAPSVVFSWIEDQRCYYVSVVRYGARFGRDKQVFVNATGVTLEDAVTEVAARFKAELIEI